MGNCCQKRKEKSKGNELILSRSVRDVSFLLMKGNICLEEIDCIVNWCDCFLMNEHTYILKQAMNERLQDELKEVKLKKGILRLNDCFSTSAGSLSQVKNIIHSTLPLWRGGNDNELQFFEESITHCIQQAVDLNMSSIGFTQSSSDIFGIPLQHCAEILVQSFIRFATNKETSIQKVYFIHPDSFAINVYRNQLAIATGSIAQDDIKSVYSDKLKDFYFSDFGDRCKFISIISNLFQYPSQSKFQCSQLTNQYSL